MRRARRLGLLLTTTAALVAGSVPSAMAAPAQPHQVVAADDPGTNLQGPGQYTWTTTTLTGDRTPVALGGIDYLVPQGIEGRLPVVTMIAGFADERGSVRWLAERLASHGILVQLIDTITPIDPPNERADAVVAAQQFLVESSPVRDLVDASREGLWGYSMGGGGVLEAASRLSGLDAVVAVFPWDVNPHFPKVDAPTMVITGQDDGVAIPSWYGQPAYASLTMPDRAFAMLAGAHHPLPSHSTDPRLAEDTVAWMTSHLEGSAAAHAFLCPGPATGVPEAGTAGYTQWQSTCP